MKKLALLFLLCISSVGWSQTISEQLAELNNTKLSIKAAIASKSVDLTGVPFTEYGFSIASIPSISSSIVTQIVLGATGTAGDLFMSEGYISEVGQPFKTSAQDANPAGVGRGAALSADGQYLAVAHDTSPYLTTYKWSAVNSRYEETAAQDANPAGVGWGAALSADGQYLAVGHNTSPYLTTYKWSAVNSRYEKTAAQDANPTGNGFDTALSADGQYLAVGHDTSPYLTTYKWSAVNSRYEKTAAQDVNPANNSYQRALSADGRYVALRVGT